VQVTDVIPSHLTYLSAGIVPNGGGFTFTSPATLSWNWPSLPVGTYSFTYQVKVNNFVAGGTVLTNNAQLTYTGMAAPQTASVNVRVTGAYTVKVDVYNEAGELVEEIYSAQLSQPVLSVVLSNSVMSNLETPVTLLFSGAPVTAWNGTNGDGVPVPNGSYYIKVQNTDPYGVSTTVSQVVTVSRSVAKVQVDIFNEAGEVVRHLYAYVDDANNSQLTSMELSANVLSIGNDQPGSGGNTNQATIVLNTGVTLTWDGRNDNGQLVTGGHYEIEVHFTNGKGRESVISKGILVQNDQNSPINGNLYAQPNILKNGTTRTTLVVNSGLNLMLHVKVYDVAGELVPASLQPPAIPNQATIDVSGLSSGLYFAVVDLTDPATGHSVGRQVTQFVVQR